MTKKGIIYKHTNISLIILGDNNFEVHYQEHEYYPREWPEIVINFEIRCLSSSE